MTNLPDRSDEHATNSETVAIPRASTLVYLVRHGETEWNVDRRMQGQLQVPLSTVGEQQARQVAEWLARQPVDFSLIYTSDLIRASKTAHTIAKRLQIDVIEKEALRELHCGDWQGMVHDEIERERPGELQRWRDHLETYTIPGGECLADVQDRMLDFFRAAAERHRGQAIIMVSHGAALSTLLAALHGKGITEWWNSPGRALGNTAVSILLYNNDTMRCESRLHNSTEHLGEVKTVASSGGKPDAI